MSQGRNTLGRHGSNASIAAEYDNPITNFSIDHYKFPKVAAAAP